MAEPVSLALAVISLAGLFNNAVVDFEYVQLGKSFAKDFEICRTKMACQQLRLSRWGAAVGINGNVTAVNSLSGVNVEQHEVKTAEDCLGQIAALFEEYRNKAKKYEQGKPGGQELVADGSPKTRSLLDRMHKIVAARRQKTGLLARVQWALYERNHFDRLLADLQVQITSLVGLWPAFSGKQQKLCYDEAKELAKEESISQLVEVASEGDPDLEKALGSAVVPKISSETNIFSGNDNKIAQNIVGGAHHIKKQTFNLS